MDLIIWQIVTGILAIAVAFGIYLLRLLKKTLSASLNREQRAYQELLDYPNVNPNPVLRVNKMGILNFANPASAPILLHWKKGLNEKIPAEWRDIIRQVLTRENPQTIELRCANSTFLLNIVPMGSATASIFGMDITERKRVELELEKRSTTDELTNLPNRIIFYQNLALEINHAKASRMKLGIYMIRIDDYHEIINTYGQAVAELFLLTFCERLASVTSQQSTIARLNENEFGVIEPQTQSPAAMVSSVQSVLEKCASPYRVKDHDIFITISIGIAFYPSDGESADILARNTQLAVERTSSTRNQYEFFQKGMVDQLQIKRNIITDLHKAVAENQFMVYYQPQINLQLKEMVSCEALIRWDHPQKGFISPFFFMTAAEETNLIMPIGEWVLRESCRQIAEWHAKGLPNIKVAVNVSARQLFQGDIVSMVQNAIRDMKIRPEWLELELTESALVQDIGNAIDIMKDLRKIGVSLALDDFGTGYSSLSYLMQFPVSKLKIDRSFIKVIEDEREEKYAVTKGIIELGHSLKLKVVAEGVETKMQLRYLKQHNCDLIQGYYFAQPQPAEKFIEFFKTEWKT